MTTQQSFFGSFCAKIDCVLTSSELDLPSKNERRGVSPIREAGPDTKRVEAYLVWRRAGGGIGIYFCISIFFFSILDSQIQLIPIRTANDKSRRQRPIQLTNSDQLFHLFAICSHLPPPPPSKNINLMMISEPSESPQLRPPRLPGPLPPHRRLSPIIRQKAKKKVAILRPPSSLEKLFFDPPPRCASSSFRLFSLFAPRFCSPARPPLSSHN